MNMTGTEFKDLFEKQYQEFKIEPNDLVTGKVVHILRDFVVVNIGFKSEGYINIEEFRDLDGEVTVAPGDTVKVMVEEIEDDNGNLVLSKERADALEAWDKVEKIFNEEGIIEGLVVNKVKGGLSVNLGGIKAFLPGSQIDLKPVKSLDKLINKKFPFKIIKLSKEKGNIVLSRRSLLEIERESLKKDILENINEGQIIKGTIKNITDYGAFVDLGGIDGLLHITDMSWGRVNHPGEVFKVNDEIEVVVLKYDSEKEKVSLGFKQLQVDPWEENINKYQAGERVKGKVVNLAEYGAFIEVEAGIEGLIHISELTWNKKVKHPNKILNIGDEVEAVILDVDKANHKMALGLKQLEPNPWNALSQKYPAGTKVKGVVRNITDFGIFVGIDNEEIDGLVHVSDLSWEKDFKWPNEDYKKGQELEVVVLNVDNENQKFSLGIKQLSDDPFAVLFRKYPSGSSVKGVIKEITDKGLLLEVGEEGFAFIPANETGAPKGRIAENFKVGDTLEALVRKFDDREKQLLASLRSFDKAQQKENMKDFMQSQGDSKVTLQDIMK